MRCMTLATGEGVSLFCVPFFQPPKGAFAFRPRTQEPFAAAGVFTPPATASEPPIGIAKPGTFSGNAIVLRFGARPARRGHPIVLRASPFRPARSTEPNRNGLPHGFVTVPGGRNNPRLNFGNLAGVGNQIDRPQGRPLVGRMRPIRPCMMLGSGLGRSGTLVAISSPQPASVLRAWFTSFWIRVFASGAAARNLTPAHPPASTVPFCFFALSVADMRAASPTPRETSRARSSVAVPSYSFAFAFCCARLRA